MNSMIGQLYYLNESPPKAQEKRFEELSKEMNSVLFDEIMRFLPPEQKKLALRVEEIYDAMLSVESETAFSKGFRTAVKLLLEAVTEETGSFL